ncbi:MAG: hypothetical protein WCP18_04115 [bacterium]
MTNKKPTDDKQLADLLATGKIDEAKKIMESIINTDLTEEQKGEVYTNLAMAAMNAETVANNKYEAMLDNAINTIKSLDKKIETVETDDKISQVKKQLDQM